MEPEYAPQYSLRERLRYAVFGIVFAAVVVGTFELWLFPQWRAFAETAHCRTVFGIAGTAVVMYVTFVGIPLGAAIVSAAFIGPAALRSIRTRQYPDPGRKMFGKVRIQTGRRAILSAAANLLLVGALFALAIWGGFQARKILEEAKPPNPRSCDAYNTLSVARPSRADTMSPGTDHGARHHGIENAPTSSVSGTGSASGSHA